MEKKGDQGDLGEQENGETRGRRAGGRKLFRVNRLLANKFVWLSTVSDHQSLSYPHVKCYTCFPQQESSCLLFVCGGLNASNWRECECFPRELQCCV